MLPVYSRESNTYSIITVRKIIHCKLKLFLFIRPQRKFLSEEKTWNKNFQDIKVLKVTIFLQKQILLVPDFKQNCNSFLHCKN